MSYYAILCYVMPYYAGLRRTMPYYALLFITIPVWRSAIYNGRDNCGIYFITVYHNMLGLCRTMPYYAVLCHCMSGMPPCPKRYRVLNIALLKLASNQLGTPYNNYRSFVPLAEFLSAETPNCPQGVDTFWLIARLGPLVLGCLLIAAHFARKWTPMLRSAMQWLQSNKGKTMHRDWSPTRPRRFYESNLPQTNPYTEQKMAEWWKSARKWTQRYSHRRQHGAVCLHGLARAPSCNPPRICLSWLNHWFCLRGKQV